MYRLALLALLLTGSLVSAQTLKKSDHDALVQMLKKAVADREVRGASLLVLVKGKMIFKEAAGSLKTSDAVRIASSTKPTTTTALMILVEAGKVKLDDTIVNYLPEFKGTAIEKATVRQLMSHTAGVPGFYPGGQRPTSGTLAEFSKRVAKGTLRKPGSFSYSGVSMDLCARICEVASGTTYEAHFKKAILDPLGMKNTSFTMTAKKADSKGNDGRWVSAGGGLSSTLDDLAAFYQMHLDGGVYNGKRLLSATNIAEMHKKHATNPMRSGPPFGSDYGLGFYLDRFTKDGAAMTVNHAGALGTVAWLDKDRDLVGVLFAPGTLRQATSLISRAMKKVRAIVPATRKVEIVEAKPAAAKFDHAAAFKKMADGKDKVSKETFAKYMSANTTGFGKGRTELWKRIFDRLDGDEDGYLTLEEFKKFRGLIRKRGKNYRTVWRCYAKVKGGGTAMNIRPQHSPQELAALIRAEPNGKRARRLAAVRLALLGHSARAIALQVLLSERQVRTWVTRYNASGLDGLADRTGRGRKGPLTAPQEEQLKGRLRAGATPADGVCSLRGRDVRRILHQEFGVVRSLDAVYALLHRLGFEPLRPRPRHPKGDLQAQEAFKKNSPP